MKNIPIKWIIANAFGLGVSFVAMLQLLMLFSYGLDFEQHWEFVPPPQTVGAYLGDLVGGLLGGGLLGVAQVLVLRSHFHWTSRWVWATVAGFGLMTVVNWPLMAMDIMGRIPGPVEPILATVGSCSIAGILQYFVLKRATVDAKKWLILWMIGLFAGVAATGLLMVGLESVSLAPSWPLEVFLSGFAVAGVASWISGKTLFVSLANRMMA